VTRPAWCSGRAHQQVAHRRCAHEQVGHRRLQHGCLQGMPTYALPSTPVHKKQARVVMSRDCACVALRGPRRGSLETVGTHASLRQPAPPPVLAPVRPRGPEAKHARRAGARAQDISDMSRGIKSEVQASLQHLGVRNAGIECHINLCAIGLSRESFALLRYTSHVTQVRARESSSRRSTPWCMEDGRKFESAPLESCMITQQLSIKVEE